MERGTAAPHFLAHVYCGYGRPFQLLLDSCLFWKQLFSVQRSAILRQSPCSRLSRSTLNLLIFFLLRLMSCSMSAMLALEAVLFFYVS